MERWDLRVIVMHNALIYIAHMFANVKLDSLEMERIALV